LIFDILGWELLGDLLSPSIELDMDELLAIQKRIEEKTGMTIKDVVQMIEKIPLVKA
jgi:hypothetical protein